MDVVVVWLNKLPLCWLFFEQDLAFKVPCAKLSNVEVTNDVGSVCSLTGTMAALLPVGAWE